MTDSVLFVDDSRDLLLGLKVMFQHVFEVETAVGGEPGLEAVRRHGPYSVVVADMRMPGMNGAEFLAQVGRLTPDAMRILLTGHADVSSAIDAVNAGNIFRYLTKPCRREVLTEALHAGVKQNHLMVSERELLEKTLMGNIKLLTEVLGATTPAIFGKSMRIQRCVRHIAARLMQPSAWQLEAAASLSQLGCVTLDIELVQQAYVGAKLSAEDQALFETHPLVASNLLTNIPRMEPVAWMIRQQMVKEIPLEMVGLPATEAAPIVVGAKVLKLVAAFDAYRMRGLEDDEAVSRMRSRDTEFEKPLLDLLLEVEAEKAGMELRKVPIGHLQIGMILEQEIRSHQGHLKVCKGQEVTAALRIRLHHLVKAGSLGGNVLALVPV